MKKAEHKSDDGFKLLNRVEALRSDQRGSLTLLAGMMVFLVTMFGIIALDTNMAIYNRIVAQNAVDSAADSAALWQARGCNLLQNLNNFHYDVDYGLAIAEDGAAAACVASGVLLAAELAADVFFGAGEVSLRPARMVTCGLCDTMPWIDLAQQLFYPAIMDIEQAIVDVTPYVAFANANACAKGSGADTIGDAIGGALNGIFSILGIEAASNILGPITSALGDIPIYAMPLDPDGFGLFSPSTKGLYVTRKDNNGWPLNQSKAVGVAGDVAGYLACEDVEPVPPLETSESWAKDARWDGNYGWNDQYFFGWPGFSTWIAGKKQQNELLGLGNLAWLNGGMKNSDYTQNANQVSKVMYPGGIWASGNTQLQIPGFVAIASSQVQGTPVICKGKADAIGTLIKVYLPGSSPKSGEDLFIFH